MSAESLKLQAAVLENLKKDIDQEIELVKGVLTKVHQALATMPEEDDVMTIKIKEVGNTLESAWNTLVDAFNQLSDALANAITTLKQKISELVQKLGEMLKGGGE